MDLRKVGTVDDFRIKAYKGKIETLQQDWQKIFKQLELTNDARIKQTIQRNLDEIQNEIDDYRNKIEALTVSSSTTPVSSSEPSENPNIETKNKSNNLTPEQPISQKTSVAISNSSNTGKSDKSNNQDSAVRVARWGFYGVVLSALIAALSSAVNSIVPNIFSDQSSPKAEEFIGGTIPTPDESEILSREQYESNTETDSSETDPPQNDTLPRPQDRQLAEDKNEQSGEEGLTEDLAVTLIENWLDAKNKIFGPSYDRNIAAQFLTGDPLEDIQNPSEGAVTWLERNDAYYVYDNQIVQEVYVMDNPERVTWMILKVYEERTFYMRGRRRPTERIAKSNKYDFKLVGDTWKISDYCPCQDNDCDVCVPVYD